MSYKTEIAKEIAEKGTKAKKTLMEVFGMSAKEADDAISRSKKNRS